MTYASFIQLYPEFSKTSTDLVIAKIGEASVLETATFWGTERETAIALSAAALIANGPLGEPVRLATSDEKGAKSIYEKELRERKAKRLRAHHCGFILI